MFVGQVSVCGSAEHSSPSRCRSIRAWLQALRGHLGLLHVISFWGQDKWAAVTMCLMWGEGAYPMAMGQVLEGKSNSISPFHTFVSITSINIIMAIANHLAELNANREGRHCKVTWQKV